MLRVFLHFEDKNHPTRLITEPSHHFISRFIFLNFMKILFVNENKNFNMHLKYFILEYPEIIIIYSILNYLLNSNFLKFSEIIFYYEIVKKKKQ